jgi:hypothetical protein
MTGLEQRLHEALKAGADSVDAAPDLFERVVASIDDDRRRRRRMFRMIGIATFLLGALAAVVYGLSETKDGRLIMAWWVLEVIVTVILIGMALWLGPFIKRFGRAYAADVFRANPRTGKSYIVLTDIVYYLIFAAYILFTVRLESERIWLGLVTAQQVQLSVIRLGGILLIIGTLHGLNIVLMPVLGRLFSLNRRLDELNRDSGLDE